jgi:hypothetical protein
VAQPRNPDAIADGEALAAVSARVDFADDFVTGNRVRAVRPDVPFGEVKIRATHAARANADADFARAGLRHRSLLEDQWPRSNGSWRSHGPRVHLRALLLGDGLTFARSRSVR